MDWGALNNRPAKALHFDNFISKSADYWISQTHYRIARPRISRLFRPVTASRRSAANLFPGVQTTGWAKGGGVDVLGWRLGRDVHQLIDFGSASFV